MEAALLYVADDLGKRFKRARAAAEAAAATRRTPEAKKPRCSCLPPPLAPARLESQKELFPVSAGDDASLDPDDHPGPESASARGPP